MSGRLQNTSKAFVASESMKSLFSLCSLKGFPLSPSSDANVEAFIQSFINERLNSPISKRPNQISSEKLLLNLLLLLLETNATVRILCSVVLLTHIYIALCCIEFRSNLQKARRTRCLPRARSSDCFWANLTETFALPHLRRRPSSHRHQRKCTAALRIDIPHSLCRIVRPPSRVLSDWRTIKRLATPTVFLTSKRCCSAGNEKKVSCK